MKKIFQSLLNNLSSKPSLTQKNTFFKTVQGTSTNSNYTDSQGQVVDKIDALNRIIVQGKQKDYLMHQIRILVTKSQLGHHIPTKLEDACEIVHYAILNNHPVLIKHIQLIDPNFDFSTQEILNENEFENLQQKKQEENPELKQDIYIENKNKAEYYQSEHYDRQREKWKQQRNNKY